MGDIVISPSPQKTKERINLGGQVIDPKTKQVIKKAETPYVPPIPGVPEEIQKGELEPKPGKLESRMREIAREEAQKLIDELL